MALALSICFQLAGLAIALAAILLDSPFIAVVMGVVIFLLGGHMVRRQLNQRQQAQRSRAQDVGSNEGGSGS